MQIDTKMKHYVGLLILLLSLSSQAIADPAKWDGFRGMKWGTHIKDFNDINLVLVENGNEYKGYRRPNDKLSIGDANLKEIIYTFYKDRFYGFKIEAQGQDNFRFLKNAVFDYYGDGRPTAKSHTSWLWTPELENSRNVRMLLSYDVSKEITKWSMGYAPILKQMYDEKSKKPK